MSWRGWRRANGLCTFSTTSHDMMRNLRAYCWEGAALMYGGAHAHSTPTRLRQVWLQGTQ